MEASALHMVEFIIGVTYDTGPRREETTLHTIFENTPQQLEKADIEWHLDSLQFIIRL